MENQNLNIKLHYPYDPDYNYFVKLDLLNLDEECMKDLSNNHGFIIKEPQQINKTIKSEDSIFSSKFGRSMQDENPYSHRFSCKFGCTQGAFFAVEGDANWVCPICGTEVKLVGDDFTFFGWIVLKPEYTVIHPTLYTLLESLIGPSNLEIIIEPNIELDINGNPMSAYDRRLLKKKNLRRFKRKTKLDSTYEGYGMIGFHDHYDEIIEYFYKKKPNKKDVYEMLKQNRDKIFTHSIPVYSTQLRIAKVENKRFTFEKTNADFNLLAKLAATINKDELSIHRNKKYQNQLLWDMQNKINSLTKEITNILAEKKGTMRSAITGRTAFSARTVIVPDSTLKMDELSLPYYALVLLLEQIIINILQSSYNITYSQAYKIWYYATLHIDERVLEIINNLIKMDKIHVLINRNPTINYQSIVWKKVVKCNTDSIVMGLDQFVLKGLNADFDGDTLSVFLILNKQFDEVCQKIYSPRNAYCISRNDGLMNNGVNVFKDTLINFNAFLSMTEKNYTQEQLDKIKYIQNKYCKD